MYLADRLTRLLYDLIYGISTKSQPVAQQNRRMVKRKWSNNADKNHLGS